MGPYEEQAPIIDPLSVAGRRDLKKVYFNFLNDFRGYLVEYVKESAIDLAISDIHVTQTPQALFQGAYGGLSVTLKNQGDVPCYLSTDRRGAYRLDPGEKERFWLNAETAILTLSGETTVGFIRS